MFPIPVLSLPGSAGTTINTHTFDRGHLETADITNPPAHLHLRRDRAIPHLTSVPLKVSIPLGIYIPGFKTSVPPLALGWMDQLRIDINTHLALFSPRQLLPPSQVRDTKGLSCDLTNGEDI